MHFTIQREALLKPLQLVAGVVERRQTPPCRRTRIDPVFLVEWREERVRGIGRLGGAEEEDVEVHGRSLC